METAVKKENYKNFYELVGTNYPEEDFVFHSLRGVVRRQFILSWLKTAAGCLLDLGCNRGYYTSAYKNGPAIGVDLSFAVLAIAKRRHRKKFFIQGDAQNISFLKSSTVNSVLCSEMLEHVPDPAAVFGECYRVLKSGGQMLLTTPNYKKVKPTWIDVGEMADFGISGVQNGKYFHTAFRPEELIELAQNVGFIVLRSGTFEKEVKYSTRIPVVFFHLVDQLNRRLFRSKQLQTVNKKFLDKVSLSIYKCCSLLKLNTVLCMLVKEGVRSFIVVKKPEQSG